MLILPLLKWAARRDKHFHTAPGMWNDELVRTNAGLFLLAGLLALAPAAVALFVGGRRSVSWMMIVVCTLFAGACELVVTVAPEPWFTW